MAPSQLSTFDAFPKLPATYKARTESRGLLTIFVALLAFFLVLNDIGEYIWGWPDYEFSIDGDRSSIMDINVDIVVNMPCATLSVDLRDAVGDRLFLSEGFDRDGTTFDVGQATSLNQYGKMLSARQAVSQSRRSRGLFSTLFRRAAPKFKPTYNHQPSGTACRIFGTVKVKKVTANLHITTAGHGYSSGQHVDHSLMNLSHVITEFSFGPYFPEIAQPLDNSFEKTDEPFIAYQYFMHVVPTTYVAPRSTPLHTNQYSVTHYSRVVEHERGTPGIFFKFDLEPLSLTIHQRTTSIIQLTVRVIGVIGGIFVCMGYAVRIGVKAVEVVTRKDDVISATPVQASGVRRKWVGGELRSRGKNDSISRVVQQGNGWVVEKDSPYGSPVASPYLNSNGTTPTFGPPSAGSLGTMIPPTHSRSVSHGSVTFAAPALHHRSPSIGGLLPTTSLAPPFTPRSPYTPSALARSALLNTTDSMPHSPAAGFSHFPPTPGPSSGFGLQNAHGNGHADSVGVGHGLPRSVSDGINDSKKDD